MIEPAPEADDWVRGPDWLKAVAMIGSAAGQEFDLTQIHAGDLLRVSTAQTIYVFKIVDPVMRDALVLANREGRPQGACRIMGCTYGRSRSIKPDHLFYGGNLEFTHAEGIRTHTTTAIRAIEWLHVKQPEVEQS